MSAVLFTDTLVANHWDQNADQWKKDVEAGLDVYERGGHVPHAQGVFLFYPRHNFEGFSSERGEVRLSLLLVISLHRSLQER